MAKQATTSPITSTTIQHVAQLATIPISADEAQKLSTAFMETLEVVDSLKQLDVSHIEPTHQVTGLTNVLREDIVDAKRMFSQADALANAAHTHQGFFVVERVIDQE